MFLFLCFVKKFQKIRLAAAAVEFPLFGGGLKLFAFTYSGFVCNFFVSFRLAAPASRRYADLRLPFFPDSTVASRQKQRLAAAASRKT